MIKNKKDEKGILKCFYNKRQYNLVYENKVFSIWTDGRKFLDLCTNEEEKAVQDFKTMFSGGIFSKFYCGFSD